MPPYKDLADLPEDERIDIIGKTAMTGKVVGFFVDDEPADKADRYIAKLTKKFPGVRVLDRKTGVSPGAIFIKVGPAGEG